MRETTRALFWRVLLLGQIEKTNSTREENTMKVDDYLKTSGLQSTASVTFNDLKALEGEAPPAEEPKKEEPAPAPAAPAPTA